MPVKDGQYHSLMRIYFFLPFGFLHTVAASSWVVITVIINIVIIIIFNERSKAVRPIPNTRMHLKIVAYSKCFVHKSG